MKLKAKLELGLGPACSFSGSSVHWAAWACGLSRFAWQQSSVSSHASQGSASEGGKTWWSNCNVRTPGLSMMDCSSYTMSNCFSHRWTEDSPFLRVVNWDLFPEWLNTRIFKHFLKTHDTSQHEPNHCPWRPASLTMMMSDGAKVGAPSQLSSKRTLLSLSGMNKQTCVSLTRN